MNNNDNKTTFLGLLKYTVNIPRIQRDYAQGRKQTTTDVIRSRFLDKLMQAIQPEGSVHLDFVYGLKRPGDEGENIFLPIDGQQRLTTLFLLHWYFLQSQADEDSDHLKPLKNFRYETRSTTAAFLRMLLEKRDSLLPKESDAELSKIIQDQNWFQASWKYDPSISGMLVMLDAIEKKNKEANLTPQSVSADSLNQITFDLILLNKETDPDLLYRKINSRGRKLTDYENFKAELFQALDEQLQNSAGDEELFSSLKQKLDTSWSNYVFRLLRDEEKDKSKNEDRTEAVDKALLNLFCSHARIFLWKQASGKSESTTPANEKQSETPEKENTTDYLRAQYYLEQIREKGGLEAFVKSFSENMEWWTMPSDAPHSYNRTIASHVASSKDIDSSKSQATELPIVIDFDGKETNPFKRICRSEDDLKTLCFFYAMGKLGKQLDEQKPSEEQIRQLHERLLLLRNFLFNADTEERYMPAMIPFIGDLMEKGSSVVLKGSSPSNSGIRQLQWTQEKLKLGLRKNWRTNNGEEDRKTLADLENHNLLRGDVSVVITGDEITGDEYSYSCEQAKKLLAILPKPGEDGNFQRALLTFAVSCTAEGFISTGNTKLMDTSVPRCLLYDANEGALREDLHSTKENAIKGNLRSMLGEFESNNYESLDGYLDALVQDVQGMDYRAYLIKYRRLLLNWGLVLNDKGTVTGWKCCYFAVNPGKIPSSLSVRQYRAQDYRSSWFWCLPELICLLCNPDSSKNPQVINVEYKNRAVIRVNANDDNDANDDILCEDKAFVIGKPDENGWSPCIKIEIPQRDAATDTLDRVLLGCAVVRALQDSESEEGKALRALREKRENAGQQTWEWKLPSYDSHRGKLGEDSTTERVTVAVTNVSGTPAPEADTVSRNQEEP